MSVDLGAMTQAPRRRLWPKPRTDSDFLPGPGIMHCDRRPGMADGKSRTAFAVGRPHRPCGWNPSGSSVSGPRWAVETVMRIDRLELRNFKKFAEFDLDLHRQFTLLIGENGAGKTSVLDALSVALGVWLVRPPDSTLTSSKRPIFPSEIRLESSQQGDRELFTEAGGGVSVKAIGQIEDHRKSHVGASHRGGQENWHGPRSEGCAGGSRIGL